MYITLNDLSFLTALAGYKDYSKMNLRKYDENSGKLNTTGNDFLNLEIFFRTCPYDYVSI